MRPDVIAYDYSIPIEYYKKGVFVKKFVLISPKKCDRVYLCSSDVCRSCIHFRYCKSKAGLKAVNMCSFVFDKNSNVCISCDNVDVCRACDKK